LIARASPPAAGMWRIVKFKLSMERRWYKPYLLYDENGRVVTFAITEGSVNDAAVSIISLRDCLAELSSMAIGHILRERYIEYARSVA